MWYNTLLFPPFLLPESACTPCVINKSSIHAMPISNVNPIGPRDPHFLCYQIEANVIASWSSWRNKTTTRKRRDRPGDLFIMECGGPFCARFTSWIDSNSVLKTHTLQRYLPSLSSFWSPWKVNQLQNTSVTCFFVYLWGWWEDSGVYIYW